MSATNILWGQILVVFAIVLLTTWMATQWTAWRLGYQPELGGPWFVIYGVLFYSPPPFFWWWFSFGAYAANLFRGRDDPRLGRSHRDHWCDRYVGLAGAGSEEYRDLWLRALGNRDRNPRRQPAFA